MPSSSTVRATAAGGSSIATPHASSRSADPHRPDAARLPCLATRTPAAATTSAATVETLNVPAPSPPVPQVSTSGPGRSMGAAAVEHGADEPGDLGGRLTLGAQRDEERGDLAASASPRMMVAHHVGGVVLVEVVAGEELFEDGGPAHGRGLGHGGS